MPGAGGTGTGGMGGLGGAGGVCDAPVAVFKDKCGICHGPGATTPDLGTNPPPDLTTQIATANSVACEGMPLINVANPAASVLLKRIQGKTCGDQMPQLIGPLSPTDMACVASWVMSKAQ